MHGKRLVALILSITTVLASITLSGCEKKKDAPVRYMRLPVVRTMEDAQKSPQSMADYFVYCILKGKYDDAWRSIKLPDSCVFSEKLLKNKCNESKMQPVQEKGDTITPDTGDGVGVKPFTTYENYKKDEIKRLGLDGGKDSVAIPIDGNGTILPSTTSRVLPDKGVASNSQPVSSGVVLPDVSSSTTLVGSNDSQSGINSMSSGNTIEVGDSTDDPYGITATTDVTQLNPVVHNDKADDNHLGETKDSKGKWSLPHIDCISIYGVVKTDNGYKVYFGRDNQGYVSGELTVQVGGDSTNGYYCSVPSIFLNDKTIKIQVRDGVQIFLNDAPVPRSLYDLHGYFVIPSYPKYDTLILRTHCAALPDSTCTLDVAKSLSKNIKEDDVRKETDRPGVFKITLTLDRQTQDDAMAWLPGGIQKVFDTICRCEDIGKTTFGGTLSNKCDKETFKVEYLRCISNINPSPSTSIKSLKVSGMNIYTPEQLAHDEVNNEVMNYNAVEIHIQLRYSFMRDSGDASVIPCDNMVQTSVYLTKDEKGNWKFFGFPVGFFKKLL